MEISNCKPHVWMLGKRRTSPRNVAEAAGKSNQRKTRTTTESVLHVPLVITAYLHCSVFRASLSRSIALLIARAIQEEGALQMMVRRSYYSLTDAVVAGVITCLLSGDHYLCRIPCRGPLLALPAPKLDSLRARTMQSTQNKSSLPDLNEKTRCCHAF